MNTCRIHQRLLLPSSNKTAHPQPISNQAWQLAATYLVTGEDATYGQVRPRRNFDPIGGGTGAWELAARVDQLLIDRDVYNYGFSGQFVNLGARGFRMDLGVNWNLNPNVEMSSTYAHTGFATAPRRDMTAPMKAAVKRIALKF